MWHPSWGHWPSTLNPVQAEPQGMATGHGFLFRWHFGEEKEDRGWSRGRSDNSPRGEMWRDLAFRGHGAQSWGCCENVCGSRYILFPEWSLDILSTLWNHFYWGLTLCGEVIKGTHPMGAAWPIFTYFYVLHIYQFLYPGTHHPGQDLEHWQGPSWFSPFPLFPGNL